MRQSFGETRSRFRDNHALISTDSHECTTLPNWPDSDLVFAITPQMGARFSQYFAHMPANAVAGPPLPGMERFFFVLHGKVDLSIAGKKHVLEPEGYGFVPAGCDHRISAQTPSRLVVLERPFVALHGAPAPDPFISNCQDLEAVPMKGDERLMLNVNRHAILTP